MVTILRALALVLLVAACTPIPLERGPAPADATTLAGAQLQPATHATLYDALAALRPTMLRAGGPGDTVVVELDGQVVGGVHELRRIRTADVFSVERVRSLAHRGAPILLRVRTR